MIARVFPRKTNASPTDALAFFREPTIENIADCIKAGVTAVHISVTFTWDLERAEELYDVWQILGVPVEVGGPAFDDRMGDFVPGMYLRDGYIFTSRGCTKECRQDLCRMQCCFVVKTDNMTRSGGASSANGAAQLLPVRNSTNIGGRAMTSKEIIQALRCCQFWEPCARCPEVSNQNCVNVMHKCAADLIERLTAEAADLRKEIEWKDMVIALAQRKQAEAEAERDALREKMPQWISVEERLPERGTQVLGWYKDNPFSPYRHEIVEWNGGGWIFVYAHRYVTDVTHWMPLPEAPEKGETA